MKTFLSLLSLLLFFSCKGNQEEEDAAAPVAAQTKQSPEIQESISRGAALYNNFCASCHLSSGEGIAGTFPPLKNSDWITEKRTRAIHAIKFGLQGPIEVNGKKYNSLMPDLGLTDQEIADIFNYIQNSWGNQSGPPASVKEVADIEK